MRPAHPTSWRIVVRAFGTAVLLVGLWPLAGAAEGAIAVGLPRDVAEEGFAFGFAINEARVDAARAEALRSCKEESPGVDKRAQALCAVVQSFRDQCFAVAMDPQDATPGVGWAVAADKATASRDALAKCVETAGDGRRDACEVSRAECDGSAK